MSREQYPYITVGQLRADLANYGDEQELDFSGLTYQGIKEYRDPAPSRLQMEFAEDISPSTIPRRP